MKAEVLLLRRYPRLLHDLVRPGDHAPHAAAAGAPRAARRTRPRQRLRGGREVGAVPGEGVHPRDQEGAREEEPEPGQEVQTVLLHSEDDQEDGVCLQIPGENIPHSSFNISSCESGKT